MNQIDGILRKLETLIAQDRFEELESDTIEIKPTPSENQSWQERYKSVNAFLNTRGGILILGIKEAGSGQQRRYVFSGYRSEQEAKVKEFATRFTDRSGIRMNLAASFPPPEVRDFMGGRVLLVFVDEIDSDLKYCFLDGTAYKRHITGDTRLLDKEIDAWEELKQEARDARELQVVPNATVNDLDVDKLNEYIQLLNRPVKVETIKPDIEAARQFLDRKKFVIDEAVTTLGMLVCGAHPGDYLGFRCQLHGYVDAPGLVAQDKQDFSANIIPLMEGGFAFLLRNIQVGISAEGGGTARPQYPETLLREVINNALAHRDYTIDRHVIVAIKPGAHIEIRNPGRFRQNLLIELAGDARILRIIPEAKPRNPKLADVLRVYRRWEGRGIGMATLVNLCLANEIDLPYYRLLQDEVRLFVCTGRLLDRAMQDLFLSFDAFITDKLDGQPPTQSQLLVLAYLIKSEKANKIQRHTILLTSDNNHYEEIATLESAGLIYRHPDSPRLANVYVAARALVRETYVHELREMFGVKFDSLNDLSKKCLFTIYQHQHFSSLSAQGPKQVSYYLWARDGQPDNDIRAFDAFYRKVIYAFSRLAKLKMIQKQGRGYLLNESYERTA